MQYNAQKVIRYMAEFEETVLKIEAECSSFEDEKIAFMSEGDQNVN